MTESAPSPAPARSGRSKCFAIVGIFVLALALGIALRVPDLGNRPMHTDEAILGVKFGGLLENGTWKYDPRDYHGPALPYLTLPFTWAAGISEVEGVSESLLRSVPLTFGIGLMLLAIPLRRAVSGAAVAFSTLFLAVSPIFVYYSRYYIMEMLLVFFCLAAIVCGWRYWISRRPWWLVPCAFSLAMMHIAKETCVIHYFAMGCAVAGCAVTGWIRPASGVAFAERVSQHPLKTVHVKPFLVTALVTWFLFYSSFFTNLPEGLIQSFTTYQSYLNRAEGSGHEKPWFYYLQLLLWTKDTYRWTEAGLFVFALIGIAFAFLRRPSAEGSLLLPRFLAIYAVVLGTVYSAIAYKTPWTILGFHHAVILLAGIGAAGLWQVVRLRWMQGILAFVVTAMCVHLGYQAKRATSPRFAADARNPYVYSHTSTAFLRLLKRLDALAEIKSDSNAAAGTEDEWLQVQVIHSEDAWPLPWYTRMHATVGFPKQVPSDDILERADVVLTEPKFADYFSQHLADTHSVSKGIHSLRPNHFLSVFIRTELRDAFFEKQSAAPEASQP